jgi:hypothetical protein
LTQTPHALSDTGRTHRSATNYPKESAVEDLDIRAVLVLSTAHLSAATCRNLNSYDGVAADETPYGWLMFVPEGDVDELAHGSDWTPELLPIVKLARTIGCEYIHFDRDAAETNLLLTFN